MTTISSARSNAGPPNPSTTIVPPKPKPFQASVGRRVAWTALFVICALYGGFAIAMGVVELQHLLGLAVEAKDRAVPPVFVAHALAGGLALVVGALQFNRRLLARAPVAHRVGGRIYVISIWITSLAGLWSAVFFDVPIAGRAALLMVALSWFLSTTLAFTLARARRIAEHQRWTIRSFALSLFFVTFPFWTAGLEATGWSEPVWYPMAVVLAWLVNAGLGEAWIRHEG